jgi:hypothetical protein
VNLAWGRPWTAEEDARVSADYVRLGGPALAAALGRSLKATQKRAARLDVLVKRPWTARDEARLSELWGLHSTRSIAMRLKRSPRGVYTRAAVLGLVARENTRTETLTDAAERVGYNRRDLAKILRRAGVLTLSKSRHPTGNNPRPWYQLDPFEVDEAVAAYVRNSPIFVAARARGVSDQKLMRALAKIGVTRPAVLKPKEQWRIPDELADRALGRCA